MSLFKRKTGASVNIEPAYEPETVPSGELDFVKGSESETAEEVIQAHLQEMNKVSETAAAQAAEPAAESIAERTVPAEPETTGTPGIMVPEYNPAKSMQAAESSEVEFITQKVPVTQHELVLNLPEFHPSEAPAIALIRGNEGYFAKDLVSGKVAMGKSEIEAREKLITLLAQPA